MAHSRVRMRLTTIAAAGIVAGTVGTGAGVSSVVHGAVLHPIRLRDASHLVAVGATGRRPSPGRSTDAVQWEHTYPWYTLVREAGLFRYVVAAGRTTMLVKTSASTQFRDLNFVDADFFRLLGVPLHMGREFLPADDRPGAPLVAIASHDFWHQVLGGSQELSEQVVRIEDRAVTIVGVVDRWFRGFDLGAQPALYLPHHAVATLGALNFAGTNYLGQTGRVPPRPWLRVVGVPLESQGALLAGLSRIVDPVAERSDTFVVRSIQELASPSRTYANLMSVTTALRIAIAVSYGVGILTAAMLLLLGADSRRRECAIRVALGATPRSMARVFLGEAAVAGTLAGIVALLVAWLVVRGAGVFPFPGSIDIRQLGIGVEPSLLASHVAGAVGMFVLLGLMTGAWAASGNYSTARGLVVEGLRTGLVVVQVAGAMVLVIGGALFGRSVAAAMAINPMVPTDRLRVADINLDPDVNPSEERALVSFSALSRSLDDVQGIERHSWILPGISLPAGRTLRVDGEDKVLPAAVVVVGIDERYFETLGISLLDGRGVEMRDAQGSPPVAVLSQSLARLVAGRGRAVGHRIATIGRPAQMAEIVGVVSDIITDITIVQPLTLYVPVGQWPRGTYVPWRKTLLVRVSSTASTVFRELEALIRRTQPGVTPQFVAFDDRVRKQMGPQRFATALLGVLGTMATMLALGGTYGMCAAFVAGRRWELAIRASLGASPARLGAHLASRVVRPMGFGAAGGLMLAWWGTGIVEALLFGVGRTDPVVYVTATFVLIGLALSVCVGPFREAIRPDVTRLLRAPGDD